MPVPLVRWPMRSGRAAGYRYRMRALRTPDTAFAGLPDFDHQPHYVDVPDPAGGVLRMAYVEVVAEFVRAG